MKIKKLIVVIVILLIITTLFSAWLYNKTKIIRKDTIKMDLEISDRGGFNLDKDAIHFGKITKGGTSKRTAQLRNSFPFDVIVSFQTYGKLAEWLRIYNSSYILHPNATQTVTFKIYSPKNASFGNYSGIIKVIYKRK